MAPQMTPLDMLAALDVVEPAARAQLAASHDTDRLGEVEFASDRLHDVELHMTGGIEHFAAVMYALLDLLAAADAGAEQEYGTKRGHFLDATFAQVRAMYAKSAQS